MPRYAAVDIGSNSVRMMAAEVSHGETVRLAEDQIPRSKRDDAERLRASYSEVRELFGQLTSSPLEARRKIAGIGPRRAEIVARRFFCGRWSCLDTVRFTTVERACATGLSPI